MTDQQKASYPVCPEHWQKLREKAIKGLSFWTKLIASGRVNKMLREQGFVESKTECRFCKKKPAADEVN